MKYPRACIIPVLVIALFLTGYHYSPAQFNKISFSAGFSTVQIIGDNPSKDLLVGQDTVNPKIGGSYLGPQPGFGFRMNLDVDEKGRFRIPVGFDYIFYQGLERVPVAYGFTVNYRNTNEVLTGLIGFNYSFFKFPFANVKAYTGIEARLAYIMQGKLHQNTVNKSKPDSVVVTNEDKYTKSSTMRLGSALKIGFVGDLVAPWYIDASMGLGIMNLVGRDNSRGELLTPHYIFENKESLLYNFQFSLLIQYHL